MKVNTSIPITFEKTGDSEDSRFSYVKVFIAHEGLNLNNSHFSKAVLDSMSDSLSGVPIVGYLADNNGNKDFSGHESKLTITEDGIEYTYLGQAYGFIPNDHNARFELKACDDGTEKNYLVADGILWNKFEDCKKIFDKDGMRSQSMELLPESVEGSFSADKTFHFTNATVEALCILGKDVKPGMMNATIEKYTFSSLKEQITNLMREFNVSTIVKVDEDNDTTTTTIEDNKKNKEDEVLVMKTKAEIATKFSLTVNQLSDELERKLQIKKYSTTNWYGEQYEAPKYYMRDFDDQYVYAIDRENGYVNVKIPYSMDGDNATYSFDETKKIKYVPTDWDEGTEDVSENFTLKVVEEGKLQFSQIKEEKEQLASKLQEKVDSLLSLNEQFSQIKQELTDKEALISSKDSEITALKEFKESVEVKQRDEKIEQIFEKFSKHLTSDEVDNFKGKIDTYKSIEEFEVDVKVFVADKVTLFINKETSTNYSTFNINTKTNTENESVPKNIWDKLEENTKN
ncbi:hypothetical protein EBB07_29485 [Paenibacillaceae bacterium]|nr:hypothetical protein EBB07_29485 [Paenibacillaceae bacterium]